jgi:hypothetical protein
MGLFSSPQRKKSRAQQITKLKNKLKKKQKIAREKAELERLRNALAKQR